MSEPTQNTIRVLSFPKRIAHVSGERLIRLAQVKYHLRKGKDHIAKSRQGLDELERRARNVERWVERESSEIEAALVAGAGIKGTIASVPTGIAPGGKQ